MRARYFARGFSPWARAEATEANLGVSGRGAEAPLYPSYSHSGTAFTSLPCPQGVQVKLGLQRLLFSPIMIAMTFIAPACGCPFHRPTFLVASAASFDTGKVDVGGLFALGDPGVAGLASHHAMGGVIEFGVSKPACRNDGFYGCR